MKTQSDNMRAEEVKRANKPVFLYYFNYQNAKFYFTNFDENLTVTGGPVGKMTDPQVFTRAQIKHDRLEQTAELNPKSLNVTLAANDARLRSYFLLAPVSQIDIEIFRANRDTLTGDIDYDDLFLEFKGIAQSVGFKDVLISVNFISPLLQEDRPIPRFFYQKNCNHQVYSTQCGVNAALFATTLSVGPVDRINKTIDLALTEINVDSPPRTITITDETFIGGYFEDADGEKFGIMANQAGAGSGGGVRLWLEYWPPDIQEGDVITVFPGCIRIPRICNDLFNNLPNYGGFPYIPIVNPTTNSISTGDPGS